MREIICLSAPAILMVVLIQIFTKRKMRVAEGILKYVVYMTVNYVCVITILGPWRKVGLVLGDHGEMNLYYGGVAIVVSMILAVVLSIFISYLNQNVRMSVRVVKNEGWNND